MQLKYFGVTPEVIWEFQLYCARNKYSVQSKKLNISKPTCVFFLN